MKINQVYEFVNTAVNEALGVAELVKEDLSNIVDAGNAVFDANAVDAYVKSLINHIGRVIFVDRIYYGGAPSLMRDSWEFGSVLEKVQADLLEAKENESWNLVDGQSYDPNIFYKPTVSAKFWNSKLTFEIPISITEMQVKQSFSNAGQLNGFIAMLFNTVSKSITVKLDELIMRVVNDGIATVISAEYTGENPDYTAKSGIRAINLLKKYNDEYGTTLTPASAVKNPEFIRYAAFEMSITMERMTRINSLFNISGKARFTPKNLMHTVMLADFAKAASIYLYSDTYHNELVKLADAETVPYWQGPGTDYSFENISTINVKTSGGLDVNVSGVLGVVFDRDAMMVANQYSRVTSNYNAKAEFTNYYYKEDISLFQDVNDEQCVVFFVA